DVIITKQQGHFVITSANGLRDILNSHGYEVRLEQQNGDGVNFSYIPGSNILKKITDDNGHSILLTRKGNYLLITSYDVKGQSVNMRLDLENDEVRNIWFPKNNNQKITDNSRLVHLNYSNNFNDHRLLNNIQYFTGMEKKFTYDCEHDMKSPTIFHHQSFIPVCVIKQTVTIPGANQPPVTINYRYTTTNSNSHNYLGYNSGLTEIPGSKTDILFEAPARYTYQTKEDNGNIQIIRTYNKYHLLIDSQTISDKNNKLLSETQSYFCHTDRSDGCANTIFNQLPVTYSLPLKIITKNWSDNQSAPALTVIERRYNDNGQIISQTDSYGRRTEITYCPHSGDTHCPAEPDSWSTVSLEERIKIFPAPVQQNIFSYPVITAMDYQKEINRNKPGYTLELYKKIIQSGKMQRTETRQYYQDNKNALTYGLLKKKCLTGENLPAGSVKSVIHHYQYILGENGTEIISGYTDIANNKPVLSSVVEKSLFYPKILRITSADKQNTQTFRYDELGRLTARTDAVGTPFETTTHYQYILSANNNSIIMTTPYGMQKEIVFDGLGRKLATYIEKTDLQGHLHPGLWQQQTQINYNTEGKVTEVTRYMDSGQRKGVPIALTTRFDYDVLGRLLRKHLPDGETEVTKYDNAQRCIIHYTQDIQNNRTTIAIDLNNVTGKPVKHIILPAISGRLPVVTTLCVQGDQLPEARVFRMTYDGFNHLVSTKDTMGKIVQNRYDALGHITDIINPVGDTLHNVYDLTGHIIQHLVLPAKGGQYLLESVGFNAAGQKLWSAKEDGNKTTYHYNINGQLSYSYKPNRHHIALYYNAIGLPAKDSLDGKVFLQVNYDHVIHKPLTVTDNTGVTAYHFRDDGLLESATHKSINGYPNTLYTLIYDSYHRLISRTDTHNNKIIYTFDALARPTGKKYQKNK
ncbi:MAG: hypothetical protein OXD32_06830, partial [Endozoicomonadaceae bacterium]|nr:hypothetical protein [Endozoicomonadaceae bacterium]